MRLSVVVAVVDGGEALARCLAALRAQDLSGGLDLIVPAEANGEYVAAGSLLELHARIDRSRAAGLAAARGEIVALIEDRVTPRPDWARRLLEAHAQLPDVAVIGGAVAAPSGTLLERAVYYCDYGRYQPPFAAGPAVWLSDVNVSYKRAALEATREIWRERYHESTVHWRLREQGALLWATPDAVVDAARGTNAPLTLAALLSERVAFARVFGWTRAREASLARRLAWLALTPALPFVLTARRIAERAQRGSVFGAGFASALPAVLVLSCAWSLGEALAYATRRA